MAAHMTYILSLSKAQWIWLIGTMVAGTLIVVVGWALEPGDEAVPAAHFTTAMAIRSIAPELGVTNKALAREYGNWICHLPIETRTNTYAGMLIACAKGEMQDCFPRFCSNSGLRERLREWKEVHLWSNLLNMPLIIFFASLLHPSNTQFS